MLLVDETTVYAGFFVCRPRGHVKKKNPKIQKDFGSGWVGQVSNWKFKKIGKHIFIHSFITFFVEHSNVYNVIN